jgi:carbohydrate-selective porin OprB
MRRRVIEVFLAVAIMTFAAGFSAAGAQEGAAPSSNTGGETTPAVTAPAPPPGWLERDTLTGDWGSGRTWLKKHGITIKPRLTQFYQGMTSGDGDHSFEYGGKADLLLNADLSKLGLWKGLSLNVHAEYNFGKSVNQRGGTIMPVNTALMFPQTVHGGWRH